MFDLVFKLSFPADLQGDLPRGLAAAVGRREELVRHPADAEGHSLLRVARVAENRAGARAGLRVQRMPHRQDLPVLVPEVEQPLARRHRHRPVPALGDLRGSGILIGKFRQI